MTIYDTTSVFTPNTAARLTFVERDEINSELVYAIETPGRQVFIHGDYGTGKSSLILNKLEQLYEYHITTFCINELTFENIFQSAFDQLNSFYISAKEYKGSSKFSAGIKSQSFAEFAFGVEKTQEDVEKLIRTTPHLLNPNNLSKLLGKMNACWLIEDFHRLSSDVSSRMAQNIKVFTDMASEYPEVKLLMTSNKNMDAFWSRFPELRPRIGFFFLETMSNNQLCKIIDHGCDLLNIQLSDDKKIEILEKAEGKPSIVHEECLRICQENGIYQTLPKRLEFG